MEEVNWGRQSDYWMMTCFEGHVMWDELCLCLGSADPEAAARASFGEFQYWCGQQEFCPTTGRHHFQMYIEFQGGSRPRRRTVYNRGYKCDLEARDGTAEQASEYCQDPEKRLHFFENLPVAWAWGEMIPSQQGHRTDIDRLRADLMAEERMTMQTIAERNFSLWLRYHTGITGFANLTERKRDWKTEVLVLWGEAETGKSAIARAYAKFKYGNSVYNKNATKWWHNYNGEKCVIVDEFFGQWDHNYWKLLCDRGAVSVEFKGGNTQFTAECIIFTSNLAPTDWWPQIGPDRWHETTRRIDHNMHCIAFEYDATMWTQTREENCVEEEEWAFPKTGPGQLWDY